MVGISETGRTGRKGDRDKQGVKREVVMKRWGGGVGTKRGGGGRGREKVGRGRGGGVKGLGVDGIGGGGKDEEWR